ncbi:MAG: rhomboid family intramembrane serine protease [Crocinitomicaceae bacterium]
MANQSFVNTIKTFFARYGVVAKIMAICVIVHLIYGIVFEIDMRVLNPSQNPNGNENIAKIFQHNWLAAPGNPADLLYKPWTLITQLFTHGDFAHLAFNMIALFFTTQFFYHFFGQKRLLPTFILGGIFAYLFHIGCYYLIPSFKVSVVHGLLGASGSIMAIFMACAFYQPKFKVALFGVIQLPLFLIAGLYIIGDLRGVFLDDGVAHLAHLGGGVFGALSIVNLHKSNNLLTVIMNFFTKFKLPKMPKFSFKRKPKMKVYKTQARDLKDEEYNASKAEHQKRVNAILDKISKKGYESLSKEEKDILFNESKRK